jgi:hypothetical protein
MPVGPPGIVLIGGMYESVEMANGAEGHFCRNCGKLAFCPQCGEKLTGKQVCHREMSTHYRDTECEYNGEWRTDYAKKGTK